MVAFTSDQWVILALVFVLGFLIGAFLLAGSGRRWKRRYKEEVREREEMTDLLHQREREFEDREKEWRERDSLRAAALKDKEREGE